RSPAPCSSPRERDPYRRNALTGNREAEALARRAPVSRPRPAADPRRSPRAGPANVEAAMDVGPEARAAHKRAASLGIFALLLVGCAPNDELVGVSIMTSLIVLVPLAACLNALVHRLWRDARQVHRPSVREAVAVWLGTITLVLLLNL